MKTNIEQVAAERGYPSTLLGYTPNDTAYWFEPGLPWASAPTTEPLARRSLRGPAKRRAELIFTSDAMAPRFPEGMLVDLEAVHTRQELEVGRVYVHLHPAGADRPHVGRLAHVGAAGLELTQDNHPTSLHWPLAAGRAPFRHVYAVTHYNQYFPRGGEARQSAATKDDGAPRFLLEVTTNEMAPRYPLGARYVVRLVPTARWGAARGVHALALINGQQLVRRIQRLHQGVFALASDRTGNTELLACVEVASIWKLGPADYLPEESEADHLWQLQQDLIRLVPTPAPSPPLPSNSPGSASPRTALPR